MKYQAWVMNYFSTEDNMDVLRSNNVEFVTESGNTAQLDWPISTFLAEFMDGGGREWQNIFLIDWLLS